jgi:hypothetical protein
MIASPSSGVELLDRYPRIQTGQDARRRVASCFVPVDDRPMPLAQLDAGRYFARDKRPSIQSGEAAASLSIGPRAPAPRLWRGSATATRRMAAGKGRAARSPFGGRAGLKIAPVAS